MVNEKRRYKIIYDHKLINQTYFWSI